MEPSPRGGVRAATHRLSLAAIAVAAGALALPAGAGAAGCAAGFSDQGNGICERVYMTTLAPETFVVPANVTSIQAVASGAEGGMSLEEQVGAGSPGGKGGRETATVPVTPGETLTILVGEAGVGGVLDPPGFGGYGGGGHSASRYGGNGGGGSFVFGADRVLIAAGGGGGGGFDANPTYRGSGDQAAPGGAGSGASPAGDGTSVRFCCAGGATPGLPGGGKGATPDAPGAGGVPDEPNLAFGPIAGETGWGPATGPDLLGKGGDSYRGNAYPYIGFAGGGGGGYNGGGGGGDIDGYLEGGGGGGGAGFVDPAATGATSQTGVQVGDGEVTIRYSTSGPPPPTAAISLAPAASDATQFGSKAITATVSGPGGKGRKVRFWVTGTNTKAQTAKTTGTLSTATYSYSSTKAGDDVVHACYDVNADTLCGVGEPTATATVHWLVAPNVHSLTGTKAGTTLVNAKVYCAPVAKAPTLKVTWKDTATHVFALKSTSSAPACSADGTPVAGATFTTVSGAGAGTVTTGTTVTSVTATYTLRDRTGDGAADTVTVDLTDPATSAPVLALHGAALTAGGLVAEGSA